MTETSADQIEQTLRTKIESFVDNPYGLVMFLFDWGVGDLKDETGPDQWQTEVLKLLGDKCLTVNDALQIAVRSGHLIGKTALIAWIILWFISTRENPQIVVTANTATQLDTKTWRELAKWHKLALNEHWFDWTATKFSFKGNPETWFAAAIPWSKARAQAFAGTHEKHVLFLYDEASEIEDIIWETTEGSIQGAGAMWIVFGNPTQNTGRFSECFKKFRHRWITREIDSRTAKKSDKKKIAQWIEDYGEDSDFVRVRVKGQEPRAGLLQFVPSSIVEMAQQRKIEVSTFKQAPKVLGCDVARFGDDSCIITLRQGLILVKQWQFRNIDTMQYAAQIAQKIQENRPTTTFVDVGAMGAGVIDRLRQLGYQIVEVNFGAAATNDKLYYNLRAEMWGKMRDWLKFASIPDDNELRDDLTGPKYGFDSKERIQLERKQDMKARGLASPDKGDSLAITFAYPVQTAITTTQRRVEDAQPPDPKAFS